MNLEDLKNIIAIVVYALVAYCSYYLAHKAKNLATKEDIGVITDKVEQVKLLYAGQLEQVKLRHQLKMAALDKRLQAHQEAFSFWAKMNKTPYGEEFKKLHVECSNWWENNCLYLDQNVRSEFLSSITAMNQHHLFVQCGQNHCWTFTDTEKLFNAIAEATLLPPITSSELAIIMNPPEE